MARPSRGRDPSVPAKRITFKGNTFDLYTSAALCGILRKNWHSFKLAEDEGFILPAYFRFGNLRYYCTQELDAVRRANRRWGFPRLKTKKGWEWSGFVKEEWTRIRDAIAKGEKVDSPLTLHFQSEAEVANFVKGFAAAFRLTDPVSVQTAIEQFYVAVRRHQELE